MEKSNKRKERLWELDIFLHQQKYPEALIQNGIQRAKEDPQTECRKTQEKTQTNNTISCITSHNPGNVFNFAKNNLPVLQGSVALKTLINENTLIQSKRQPTNRKQLLTWARFEFNTTERQYVVEKYNDSRRDTSQYTRTGNTISTNS